MPARWLLKEVIESSGNTPADVPAMAIYSSWIKDALESGEVIVRAHSTHTVLVCGSGKSVNAEQIS
ncbi:hypothetical protein VE04_06864, partial [Pseudogymnoascus sp. 24MN13]